MKVTFKDYNKDLAAFIAKHSKKNDWRVITSPISGGTYHKSYLFENGATFEEINSMEYNEQIEVEVNGIRAKVSVPMVKHEYWSTDDATSKFWYEAL